ncbi:MAG: hypothetical protein PUJ47_03475 [Clostridia bacterium]|nr:hypothetical protein [Clostridia bacterium]
MYDSGVKCSDFINSIIGEADISIEIQSDSWYRWLNTVEQFIYTEILDEYASAEINYASDSVTLSTLTVPSGCASVTYDDVISVYADGVQVEKSCIKGVMNFSDKNLYYTDYNGNLILSLTEVPNKITVIYRLRPILKTETGNNNVAVPAEFLDMVSARLRGEAYKIANEDGLAGKWLADYNTQLESFKVWAEKRNKRYGG